MMWVFTVGTVVGTGLFALCNREDNPGFLDLPKGAKIVRSTEMEMWFDAPGQTLGSIAKLNGMTIVNGKFQKNVDPFKRVLDIEDGHFHAEQTIAMDGSDDLSRVIQNK